jgi:cell division protease FtsH
MVCEWGMSDLIGPIAIGKKEESVFLGRDFHQGSRGDNSQKTAELVDSEVHRIITQNYDRGVVILKEKMEILHKMARTLVERETLDRTEIELLMQGKDLPEYIPEIKNVASCSAEASNSQGTNTKDILNMPNPKTEVA